MSDLPSEYKPRPPENWVSKTHLIEKTLHQVEKDFALQGFSLSLNTEADRYPILVSLLAQKIEVLDLAHTGNLPALLYQIDLPEKELRQILPNTSADLFYLVLADAIIRRCFQKVITRELFPKG